MILVDTSGLISALDPRQSHHELAARVLVERHPRLLSPFVLAEADYLISTKQGGSEELKLLRDVARGVYRLEPFSSSDIEFAAAIIERYKDLQLGLADASLMVLAERHGCRDILTLDQRHFRAVHGPGWVPFRLLPFDA